MWVERYFDTMGYSVIFLDDSTISNTQACADYISSPGINVGIIYCSNSNGFRGAGALLPIFEVIARGSTRVTHLKFSNIRDMLNFNGIIALMTHPNSTLNALTFDGCYENRGQELLRALATPSVIERFDFSRGTKQVMERRKLYFTLITARVWRLGRHSRMRLFPNELMRALAIFLY